jgi:hypothetical protein
MKLWIPEFPKIAESTPRIGQDMACAKGGGGEAIVFELQK